jgi:hypothetical protein
VDDGQMSKAGALIRRRPAISGAAGLACLLGVLLVAGGGSGDGEDGSDESLGEQLRVALDRPRPARIEVTQPAPPPEPKPKARAEKYLHRIATVLPGGRIGLYDEPRGSRLAVLGERTEFGSDRNFWIVRRHGHWLAVTTDAIRNGGLGWIRDDSQIRIGHSPWWLAADVSDRIVKLWRGKRIVHRFAVSVGAPGSPTPPGRYSVTDGLTTRGLERFYGCCVLALSGHQPNLPSGWIGGDRMAIHGTPATVGVANSGGCLRASDTDMQALFRRIPLGTPVLIRR